MAETTQNTKETEVKQVGDTQVVRESMSTDSTAETRFTFGNGVWLLLAVLEIVLGFRLVLRMLGANPESAFVDFVYSVSDFFAWPFHGIFSSATNQGDITTGVFEPSTLIAMVVYALIAWGIVKVINLNQPE